MVTAQIIYQKGQEATQFTSLFSWLIISYISCLFMWRQITSQETLRSIRVTQQPFVLIAFGRIFADFADFITTCESFIIQLEIYFCKKLDLLCNQLLLFKRYASTSKILPHKIFRLYKIAWRFAVEVGKSLKLTEGLVTVLIFLDARVYSSSVFKQYTHNDR